MSSKTDLAGLLRNDPECVYSRMHKWFTEGDPGKKGEPLGMPAMIRVLHRPQGQQSWDNLVELPVQAIPTTPDSLVDAIEAAIVERLGPTPIGQLRVRGWGQGCAAMPGLDVTRTLSLGDESLENSFLLRDNAELRRTIRDKDQVLLQMALGGQNLAGSLGQSLATAATQRVVSSSAADVSGVNGLLGLLALLMFRGQIGDVLDGKPTALTRAGHKVLGLLLGEDAGAGVVQDPMIQLMLRDNELGPYTRALLDDPRAQELTRKLTEQSPHADANQVIQALLLDVEVGPKVRELLAHPRAQALMMFAKGAVNLTGSKPENASSPEAT